MAAPIGVANNTNMAVTTQGQGAPAAAAATDDGLQQDLVSGAHAEQDHHDPTKNGDADLSNTSNDDVEAQKEKHSSPAETVGKGSAGADETDLDDAAERERRSSVVMALARSYSRQNGGPDDNPFLAGPDSPLNPKSEKFNGMDWAKAIVELVHQGGSKFRYSSVAFQNLNVYGFGASTDFQKDVANVWVSLAGMARSLFSGGDKQRIDILRGFDGVVKKGEMLVVLGPPGSGCSTFLKTIAGEMNGLYHDDTSYFNYHGKSACQTLSRTVSVLCQCLRFRLVFMSAILTRIGLHMIGAQ